MVYLRFILEALQHSPLPTAPLPSFASGPLTLPFVVDALPSSDLPGTGFASFSPSSTVTFSPIYSRLLDHALSKTFAGHPKTPSYIVANVKFIVWIIAIVSSTFSVLMGVVAFYFFTRMEKRYRHKLIIVNISGDILRAFWYTLFAAASLAGHNTDANTALCQMTGYFLSVGHEVTDLSVLIISIHGAMQIYNPVIDPHDPRYGLNPWRHYITALLLIFPNLMASLAFVGSHGGYSPGGSVCWLPIRPIWYRLALSWIPRYIVFIVITVLSIAVYAHVGNQFRSFRRLWTNTFKSSETLNRDWTARPNSHMTSDQATGNASSVSEGGPLGPLRNPNAAGENALNSAPQLPSLPSGLASALTSTRDFGARRHTTDLGSLVGNQIAAAMPSGELRYIDISGAREHIPPLSDFQEPASQTISEDGGRRVSVLTNSTARSQQTQTSHQSSSNNFRSRGHCSLSGGVTSGSVSPGGTQHQAGLGQFEVGLANDADLEKMQTTANVSMGEAGPEARRQTMIKQLRTTFIYPLVYMTLWLMPFTLHCMQYTTKYSKKSPGSLAAISTCCIASMGFVNALAFLIRERPWLEVGVFPASWNIKKLRMSPATIELSTISEKLSHRVQENRTSSDGARQDSSAARQDSVVTGEGAGSEAQEARRGSAASSSYFSHMGTMGGESAQSPGEIRHAARPSSKVWSAKQRALERLALERGDRTRQIQETRLQMQGHSARHEPEHQQTEAEGAAVTMADKATIMANTTPVGPSRNWWDAMGEESSSEGDDDNSHVDETGGTVHPLHDVDDIMVYPRDQYSRRSAALQPGGSIPKSASEDNLASFSSRRES